ncbi:hypothetical protein [Aeromicrobium stalagmiti]|uniref:hypothetical protein n=1 Tax=Aeromicrobium stalagmiti TaxID=2738988 RepID=UPI001567D855|nr:hypothetical protein [Aeromicrobium stalagmiti]NRQ48613.1 hypothetical protein [Aeromicrobium stalagmiti]
MGPNELKLQEIAGTGASGAATKKRAWKDSYAEVDDLLIDLRIHRARTRNAWTGADAEAASAAFDKKVTELETYRDQMRDSALAMEEARNGLANAKTNLAGLPAVGAPPVSPGTIDAGATKDEQDAHSEKLRDHAMAERAHTDAIEAREKRAGEALTEFEASVKVAQALLSKAAPRGDQPVDSADRGGDGPGTSTTNGTTGSTGGSSTGTPVVGGSASIDQMLTTTGAVATTGLIGGIKSPPGTQGSTQDGNAGSNAGQDLTGGAGGSAGMIGGGGTSAATSAAGVLGAGRGLLNRLTGGAASGSAGAPAGSGRTAGMQNGSTLGSRTAGQPASGSSAARPGGAPSSGAQSSAGRPGGAQPSGGRSGGSGQAGSRGAGPGTGSRSSGTGGTGGRGAGSGAGRGGQQRDGDDQTLDHMAFDDDQWLDDDETSPGVIA